VNAGLTGGVGIGRKCLQMSRVSASNSSSLGAQSGEREGEEWRGRCGGFIAAGLDGQLGRGDGAGVTPATLLEREEKPSEESEPTGGSHLSFVEEKGEGTLSGFLAGWAVGPFLVLGRKGSRGPISYFSFSSSFLFLFSYFLHRFCILNSNDFKPIAKVF
jgi:hypothetical protein